MIEYHWDFIAPWWVVPLFFVCLAAFTLVLMGIIWLIERKGR